MDMQLIWGKYKMNNESLKGNFLENRCLEDQNGDVHNILKWILGALVGMMQTGLKWFKILTKGGQCISTVELMGVITRELVLPILKRYVLYFEIKSLATLRALGNCTMYKDSAKCFSAPTQSTIQGFTLVPARQ
jgi:hypothetical protein